MPKRDQNWTVLVNEAQLQKKPRVAKIHTEEEWESHKQLIISLSTNSSYEAVLATMKDIGFEITYDTLLLEGNSNSYKHCPTAKDDG